MVKRRPLLWQAVWSVWALVMAVILAGCSSEAQGDTHGDEMALPEISAIELEAGEALNVVATTSVIGDVVANISSDAIDLTVLIDRGQDPHSYQLVAQDLVAVENADIIFVNGFGLEETLMDSIENVAAGVIVPVSAGIEPLTADTEHAHSDEADEADAQDHQEAASESDPHVWMDPNNVIVWAHNIEQVLAAADPDHRETYERQAAAYIAELEALDTTIREQVAHIPPDNRKLVTDHGIFSYFADEYGFEIIGVVVPGFSTTASTSAGGAAELVDIIQREDVPAIFIGTTASQGLRDLSVAIGEEAGERIRVLPLLSGSLAPPGERGDTYLDYMRYNTEQIVSGLAN